jgi:hypothetical protein
LYDQPTRCTQITKLLNLGPEFDFAAVALDPDIDINTSTHSYTMKVDYITSSLLVPDAHPCFLENVGKKGV